LGLGESKEREDISKQREVANSMGAGFFSFEAKEERGAGYTLLLLLCTVVF